MMPLTVVTNEGYVNNDPHLSWQLDKLKEANADGFMVDVWWGLTEKQPKQYDFSAYEKLVSMAEQRGMRVQLVASFHQCGGNVGDDCFIPLPSFVTGESDIWFKDQHGNENKEYISFFADEVAVGDDRSPLNMYGDWLSALSATFSDKLGGTIAEVQVGLGPCGELRYPSYPMSLG
jgi:beta-amylase